MSHIINPRSRSTKIIIYDKGGRSAQDPGEEIAVLSIYNDPYMNTLVLLPVINNFDVYRELQVSILDGALTKDLVGQAIKMGAIGWIYHPDNSNRVVCHNLVRSRNEISLIALKRLELEEPINIQTREGPMKITHICARTDVSYQYFNESLEFGPGAYHGAYAFDGDANLRNLVAYILKISTLDVLDPVIID